MATTAISGRDCSMTDRRRRYHNALIGLAAGDAWGYQVDTQMALALPDALGGATLGGIDLDDVEAVSAAITREFIAWARSPLNTLRPAPRVWLDRSPRGRGTVVDRCDRVRWVRICCGAWARYSTPATRGWNRLIPECGWGIGRPPRARSCANICGTRRPPWPTRAPTDR